MPNHIHGILVINNPVGPNDGNDKSATNDGKGAINDGRDAINRVSTAMVTTGGIYYR